MKEYTLGIVPSHILQYQNISWYYLDKYFSVNFFWTQISNYSNLNQFSRLASKICEFRKSLQEVGVSMCSSIKLIGGRWMFVIMKHVWIIYTSIKSGVWFFLLQIPKFTSPSFLFGIIWEINMPFLCSFFDIEWKLLFCLICIGLSPCLYS